MINSSEFIAFYGIDSENRIIERSLESASVVGFEIEHASSLETMEKYEKVRVPYDDWELVFKWNKLSSRSMDEPVLSITIDEEYDSSVGSGGERDPSMMDIVFELVCQLSVSLDPDFVAWFNINDRMLDVLPDGRPYNKSVETIPRFGVYSPDVLDSFGGVDELFDGEPWYVAELSNRSTLVIETSSPWGDSGWHPPNDINSLGER